MLYPSQNAVLGTSEYFNHIGNKDQMLAKNDTKNCEIVGKIQDDKMPGFGDIFNGEDLLKDDTQKNLLNIKKENTNADVINETLTHSKPGEESKREPKKTINDEDDLFGDEGSDNEKFEYDSQDLKDIDEANADDDSGLKAEEDPDTFPPTKDMDDRMYSYPNPTGYVPKQEQMNMYMDPHDPMNAHGYGQNPYMISQPMYNDAMYGHQQMVPMQYIKAEGEMGGFYPMDQQFAEYYAQQAQKDMKKEKTPGKGKKRNKYKMLPTALKCKAVELAHFQSAKFAAKHYSVPLKSLKRWMKVGCERKKGGGRKTKDPLMEKNLHNWYVEKKARGEIITAKMIKEKAIQLTNCSDFIASKGWLDKFKVRYNLEISKESAKEGHKRRSIPSMRNRGMERVTSYPHHPQATMFSDLDQFKSYRRSINKSIKQENHDYDHPNKTMDIRGESNQFQDYQIDSQIKQEVLPHNESYHEAAQNKLESHLSSMLTPTNHVYPSNKKATDSKATNLPLCNGDEGDYEFTAT